MFLFPLLLSTFANDGENRYIWMAPLITFVTVTSFTVLHKVARALEDPFVHPPNDLAGFTGRLQLPATHNDYAGRRTPSSLVSRLALKGAMRVSTRRSRPNSRRMRASMTRELVEEYAYLEPEEVKKVTYDFLKDGGPQGREAAKFFTDKVATPRLVRNSQPSMRRIPSYTASSPRPASFETNKNGKAKLQVEMMPTTPSPGGAKGFKPMKEEVVSVVPDGAVA